MQLRLAQWLVCCLTVSGVAAQQTWIADPSGNGTHTSLAAAIAAASDGDTVLVRGYHAGGVVVAKNLVIEGDPVATLESQWSVVRVNTSGKVVLRNLTVRSVPFSSDLSAGCGVVGTCGELRIESCTITTQNQDTNAGSSGVPAVDVLTPRMVARDSQFVAADADHFDPCCGHFQELTGAPGAPAIIGPAELYLIRSHAQGGAGADGYATSLPTSAAGGPGAEGVIAGVVHHYMGSATDGAPGAVYLISCDFCGLPASNGQLLANGPPPPPLCGPWIPLTADPGDAIATTFGQGCPSSSGTPVALRTSLPRLGSWLEFEASGLTPGRAGVLFLSLDDQSWSGIPLPLSLDSYGMVGCTMLVDIDCVTRAIHSAPDGSARFAAPIPADPLVYGFTVYAQYVSVDPGANALGVCSSNAVRATAGI